MYPVPLVGEAAVVLLGGQKNLKQFPAFFLCALLAGGK